MARPYSKLRSLMLENDITQADLCEIMHRSKRYITLRFTAQYSWPQNEMYFLMDLLNYPYDKMHELFPKEGKKIS